MSFDYTFWGCKVFLSMLLKGGSARQQQHPNGNREYQEKTPTPGLIISQEIVAKTSWLVPV